MPVDFEKAFGDFLDRREYDQAESALFFMVRISFKAGWLAAGGKPPTPQTPQTPQTVVELVRHHRIISLDNSFDGIETDIRLDTETDTNT